MLPRRNTSISFSERLATAFVSIFAAAGTLLVLPWLFAASGRGSEPFLIYAWVFSKTGLIIIASAAVSGFILGSEKMAIVLSFFWGTHAVWEDEWFQKIIVAVIIIVIVGVVGNLVFSR